MDAILIDDEQDALEALTAALAAFCPQVRVIATARSAEEGLTLIHASHVDLVFLDIRMPRMSGIELLEQLGTDRSFEVVFVTAHGDQVVRALRLCAFDYLLKPIDVEELAAMVQRFKHKRNSISHPDRASALRAALADRLPVHTARGTEWIDLSSITRIEASGSYSIIHTSASAKPKLISRKLGELEATLEGRGFFRAHRSHLVNVKHIVRYVPEKDGALLHLSDGAEVEVARAKKHVFAGSIG